MNFLAHIYLSGENEKLMIGNFIGDFVKGSQLDNYDKEIALGIKLHRAIDEFTDSHLMVSNSKAKLREKYRHYSGVIVDVYYDHFLSKNWLDYHPIDLPLFTRKTYEVINSYTSVLPKGAAYMLPHMTENNWLLNYSKIEGINKALTGMSKRTKFNSKMEEASKDLRMNYDEFETEFRTFFEDVRKFSGDWIKTEGL